MKKSYITEEERKRCERVRVAFTELYETEDIFVADAGRYGFVKLQYYKEENGFDCHWTFTDAKELFEDLWTDWYEIQLLRFAKDTPMLEFEYEDIFKCMPETMQTDIIGKREEFRKAAGL